MSNRVSAGSTATRSWTYSGSSTATVSKNVPSATRNVPTGRERPGPRGGPRSEERRGGDWSSDVCSSDLDLGLFDPLPRGRVEVGGLLVHKTHVESGLGRQHGDPFVDVQRQQYRHGEQERAERHQERSHRKGTAGATWRA